MVYSESEIVHELEAGNEVCLNMLFDNYYRALCVYALRFVSNADDVEDIVQEVFVSFWMNKKRTVFSGSVRSYLFGAVAKAASKFATRRGRIMFDDVEKYVDQFLEELAEYDESEFSRLRDKVYARVEALPGKTKEIFKAVVLDNLTYQQVGDRFGIIREYREDNVLQGIETVKRRAGWKRFGVVFYYFAISFYSFILIKIIFPAIFPKKVVISFSIFRYIRENRLR